MAVIALWRLVQFSGGSVSPRGRRERQPAIVVTGVTSGVFDRFPQELTQVGQGVHPG
jgi:hypothetical protein